MASRTSTSSNNIQEDDDDDLFNSLGGSLMNELLADLAIGSNNTGFGGTNNNNDDDGNWLNLEQLEYELRRLDTNNNTNNTTSVLDYSSMYNNTTTTSNNDYGTAPSVSGLLSSTFAPPTTAAGWLVGSTSTGGIGGTSTSTSTTDQSFLDTFLFNSINTDQQQQQQQLQNSSSVSSTNNLGIDAWTTSFQKFTSTSLEEDFLLADTHRKQQTQTQNQGTSSSFGIPSSTAVSSSTQVPLPPPGLSQNQNQNQQKHSVVVQVPLPPPGINNIAIEQLLQSAEDYDTTERPTLPPLQGLPPGLIQSSTSASATARTAATTIVDQQSTVSEQAPIKLTKDVLATKSSNFKKIPKPVPITPQNSISVVQNQQQSSSTTTATVADATVPLIKKILSRPIDMEPLPQDKKLISSTTPTPAVAAPVAVAVPTESTPVGQVQQQQQQATEPTTILQRPTAQRSVPVPGGQVPVAPPVVVAVPMAVQVQVPVQHPTQPALPPHNAWGVQVPIGAMGLPSTQLLAPNHGMPVPVPMMIPPPVQQQLLPPPPVKMLFCNPHYNAPSIPATTIKSRYMKPRDITYVVHGILKSIIISQQNSNPADRYDIQYYQRHILGISNTNGITPALQIPNPLGAGTGTGTAGVSTGSKSLANIMLQRKKQQEQKEQEITDGTPKTELESRLVKAKEWSQTNSTLGHTTKRNVARPRALIALKSSTNGIDDDDNTTNTMNDDTTLTDQQQKQQQRAVLWKSRIYVDQVYQAFSSLTDAWRLHTKPGEIPTAVSVQPHLLKLLKCLGISGKSITTGTSSTSVVAEQKVKVKIDDDFPGDNVNDDEPTVVPIQRAQYICDPTILQLLFKLPKGKIIVSRVLEQTLLPPPVVHVLIPNIITVLVSSTTTKLGNQSLDQIQSDDRLFNIVARIIQSIPDFTTDNIINCCTIIQQYSPISLSTTARMHCTHALLHRGSNIAAAAAAVTTNPTTGTSSTENGIDDESFHTQWAIIEDKFIQILSGL